MRDLRLVLTRPSARSQHGNYGEELWGTATKVLVDASRGRGDVPPDLSRQPTGINDRQEISGVTPLHITCDHGHAAGANELLSRGAEVDACDSRGVTALMYASEDGQEATVRLLLRHQAKINLGDEDGTTALHLACRHARAHPRHARRAVSHARSACRRTPPLNAQSVNSAHRRYGHIDTARTLLASSANADAVENDGTSALMCVCGMMNNEDESLVRLLIAAGANINHR